MLISQFVLNQGKVPINPFMSFDYYLADMVERDMIRNANNNLLAIADELWVFGSISDGVMAEINQSREQNKPIRYFAIENDKDIFEIKLDQLIFEEGVE